MTTTHRIALLRGDGIGPEVMTQACRVLDTAASRFNLALEITEYDLGSRRYLATGEVMPDSVFAEISEQAAILMGPFGSPNVPDESLKQIEQRFRLEYDLFVGYRPCRLLAGVPTPIVDLTPEKCDVVIIRENNEGLFSSAGGSAYPGTRREVATQVPMITRFGVERTVRYAFEVAKRRRNHLTVSHKTSPLKHTGGLWERVVQEVASEYPGVTTEYEKIDKVCMRLITQTEGFDVIVSDTIFGDIISDVGAALQGGKHFAPSGMINPDRSVPSMFEPLHGTAHDIAGSDKADPTGAIRTAALLLDHLGEVEAANSIEDAIARSKTGGHETRTTSRIGDDVCEALSMAS